MDNPEVEGHPDLARDSGSGAIINRNTYSYQQYMESYKKRIEKENRLDNLEPFDEEYLINEKCFNNQLWFTRIIFNQKNFKKRYGIK